MQRYEKYKDSGIDWLGEIPEHWDKSKLKYLCGIYTGYTPPTENKDNFHDDGVLWVKPNNLEGLKYIYETDEKVSLTAIRNGYLIPINSILVCSIGTIGKIGIAGDNLITNQQINSFVFNEKVNSGFSKYMVFNAEKVFDKFSNGNVVKIINTAAQKEIEFCLPPVLEQEAIAKFLDDKCEKIDTTVNLKEQQIEKLKELRKITIHNAVTKGISQFTGEAVTMKDSGIDWIGEIPKHWAILSLKHLSRKIVDGAHFTPTYVDSGVPFLRVTDLSNSSIDRKIDWTNVKYIPKVEHKELIKRANPERGDILLSKNGTIGLTRVIDWDEEFSFFVSLCLIKPIEKLSANYFEFFFNCPIVDRQINDGSSRTSVTNLHLEKIKELLIILPPLSEQQEIVSYLDKQTSKIDKAIAQKQEQIVKLKEYKQSLINEVVTGKIKVAV